MGARVFKTIIGIALLTVELEDWRCEVGFHELHILTFFMGIMTVLGDGQGSGLFPWSSIFEMEAKSEAERSALRVFEFHPLRLCREGIEDWAILSGNVFACGPKGARSGVVYLIDASDRKNNIGLISFV